VSATLIAAYKGAAGPDVLAFVRTWCRSSDRPVTVATVYPGPAPIGIGRIDAEWVAYNHEQATGILAEARAGLDGAGIEAQFEALGSDSASHGLHDAMERAGADALAVLGSKKTRDVRRTVPGGTAERLLHGAPGPVGLVPWGYEEQPAPGIRRIAVAYIDTPDGRAALHSAAAMAIELGAELVICSVMPDTLVNPALGEPAVFAASQRAAYESVLAAAVAALPAGVVGSSRLLEGPVVDALADIRPDHADLLVCGSRGYGPALRVLLGGVSSRVLRAARIPLVVVPRG
jgi:nucleotide-binding universal stress UspA family protein